MSSLKHNIPCPCKLQGIIIVMCKKIRYHNKKKSYIDRTFFVCADKRETGLPYDILLDSLGEKKRFSGVPRVGVIINDIVVPVSISDAPAILSGYKMEHADIIYGWVRKHRIALLQHWNQVINDLEVLILTTRGHV